MAELATEVVEGCGMRKGDVVRVRDFYGKSYLARVTRVTSRSAHIRWLSEVPVIEGRRRREIPWPLKAFQPHGKAGIAYTASGEGRG